MEENTINVTELFAAIQGNESGKIGDAIKKLLNAHGVKEVILASPLSPDFPLSDYDKGFDLEDIDRNIDAADVEEWWMPEWLYEYDPCILELVKDNRDPDDDFPRFGHQDSSLLVRLGIVDNEVKFTKQPKWFDEMTYESGEEPESDWLPIESISDLSFWRELLEALVKVDDVWIYTSQYPNLHRLT